MERVSRARRSSSSDARRRARRCGQKARRGARRGADASQAVLRRAARTASLNDVDVETRLFDWDDLDGCDGRRTSCYARTVCILRERALTAEINFAYSGSRAPLSRLLQPGRRGVAAFWGLMADAMEEVETKEAGDHVLKVYRSKDGGTVRWNGSERGEAGGLQGVYGGPQDDLRTMAVTMESDMQRLLGALSAAAAGQADARIRALEAERRVAELEAGGAARRGGGCGGTV